jgi:hypothetical protein
MFKKIQQLQCFVTKKTYFVKTLDKELNQIVSQIKTTNSELTEVREELAIAKGQEAAQYESMMTRIKYMY